MERMRIDLDCRQPPRSFEPLLFGADHRVVTNVEVAGDGHQLAQPARALQGVVPDAQVTTDAGTI